MAGGGDFRSECGENTTPLPLMERERHTFPGGARLFLPGSSAYGEYGGVGAAPPLMGQGTGPLRGPGVEPLGI